ncbi:MAG: hypothetical protein H6729_08045 [Deltaproteobacteria bacterium]|nr:hypothetical protein [Deltaproteobacteria bacterium]
MVRRLAPGIEPRHGSEARRLPDVQRRLPDAHRRRLTAGILAIDLAAGCAGAQAVAGPTAPLAPEPCAPGRAVIDEYTRIGSLNRLRTFLAHGGYQIAESAGVVLARGAECVHVFTLRTGDSLRLEPGMVSPKRKLDAGAKNEPLVRANAGNKQAEQAEQVQQAEQVRLAEVDALSRAFGPPATDAEVDLSRQRLKAEREAACRAADSGVGGPSVCDQIDAALRCETLAAPNTNVVVTGDEGSRSARILSVDASSDQTGCVFAAQIPKGDQVCGAILTPLDNGGWVVSGPVHEGNCRFPGGTPGDGN